LLAGQNTHSQIDQPTVLELEDALERILSAVRPLNEEMIDLKAGANRTLTRPIASPIDLPLFDNSAMDGYAVQAADLGTTAPERPASLHLLGRVAAGEVFAGSVEPGTCVQVFTGSPLPKGADAVVMQEDTRTEQSAPDQVWFLDTISPGENVRLRGEDVKRGQVLLHEGERLTAGRIGLLAATGLAKVSVGRQPRVGLLATGSELIEAGQPIASGQIYESNRPMLAIEIERIGGSARTFPLVPDEPGPTRASLGLALEACDALVTCGGVSVGEFDFVRPAFEELGGRLDFWKVAIRPGKPFAFGRVGDKYLFGLPGNPVSAWVTFLLLVRPALLRMQGRNEASLPRFSAILAEPLANPRNRRHFIRVAVDEHGRTRPCGRQASHVLSSLASANGLVDVPPGVTYPAGATVSVLHWD